MHFQINNKKYYYCTKRIKEKCTGQVIVSPNGTIVKRVEHKRTCNKASHNINRESVMSSEEVRECSKTAKKEVFPRCSVVLVDLKKSEEVRERSKNIEKVIVLCNTNTIKKYN